MELPINTYSKWPFKEAHTFDLAHHILYINCTNLIMVMKRIYLLNNILIMHWCHFHWNLDLSVSVFILLSSTLPVDGHIWVNGTITKSNPGPTICSMGSSSIVFDIIFGVIHIDRGTIGLTTIAISIIRNHSKSVFTLFWLLRISIWIGTLFHCVK